MLHFVTHFDGYGFGSRFGTWQATERDLPLALPGDADDVYGFSPLSRAPERTIRVLPDDILWVGCVDSAGDPGEGLSENASIAETMVYLGIS